MVESVAMEMIWFGADVDWEDWEGAMADGDDVKRDGINERNADPKVGSRKLCSWKRSVKHRTLSVHQVGIEHKYHCQRPTLFR